MKRRWMAVVASFLTMGLVMFLGVVLVFRPLAAGDAASPAWAPGLAVPVYLLLSIALFDWTARRMGNAYSAAFVIGASQFIFIVDLLSRGERGVMTAVAGAVLLLLTWLSVAFVYSQLGGKKPR